MLLVLRLDGGPPGNGGQRVHIHTVQERSREWLKADVLYHLSQIGFCLVNEFVCVCVRKSESKTKTERYRKTETERERERVQGEKL